MDNNLMKNFNYIVSYLTPRLQNIISKMDKSLVYHVQEIRLRAERPIIIVLKNNCYFINQYGKLNSLYSLSCIKVGISEINDIFNKMCDYSLHSHFEDTVNGYITLKNGARVGLTGTAVYDGLRLKGIKCIDGLNIRVPRNIKNFSSVIFNEIYKSSVDNLLIAGAPSSGKTTMLKDLIFQLSSGKTGRYYKICVIDERRELMATSSDLEAVGYNTDILSGFSKSVGISMAVRALSPEIIACDEISYDNSEAIIKAMNSGVKFIFTIHSDSMDELKNKHIYRKLDEYGCIKDIIFINSFNNFTVINGDDVKEVKYEKIYDSDNNYYCNISYD